MKHGVMFRHQPAEGTEASDATSEVNHFGVDLDEMEDDLEESVANDGSGSDSTHLSTSYSKSCQS